MRWRPQLVKIRRSLLQILDLKMSNPVRGKVRMSRVDLLPIYLSGLEQAKCELARAEKTSLASTDALEKVRWTLDAEVRRALVRVYDGLITFVQQPE
jgi:hypothetical protein